MVLPCDCSSWAEVCPMGLVWDVRAICCPGHSHFLLSSFPLLGLAGACKVQGLLPAAVPPSTESSPKLLCLLVPAHLLG